MQQSVRRQIRNQLRRRKFDKAINAMAENFFAYSVVFKTLMIPGYRNVPLLWKSRRMKGEKTGRGI
jgi:hypothetical protein